MQNTRSIRKRNETGKTAKNPTMIIKKSSAPLLSAVTRPSKQYLLSKQKDPSRKAQEGRKQSPKAKPLISTLRKKLTVQKVGRKKNELNEQNFQWVIKFLNGADMLL